LTRAGEGGTLEVPFVLDEGPPASVGVAIDAVQVAGEADG